MNVEQGNDRLTIKYAPDSWNIHAGLISFFLVIASIFFWRASSATQQWSLVATACLTLFALGCVLFGLYVLFVRPNITTFDRASRELTILHRTLLSQKQQHFPLSDIKEVLLVGDTPGDDHFVSLVLHGHQESGNQKENYKQITMESSDRSSERAKADIVAHFLGLEVQEETVMAYLLRRNNSIQNSQNKKSKVSP